MKRADAFSSWWKYKCKIKRTELNVHFYVINSVGVNNRLKSMRMNIVNKDLLEFLLKACGGPAKKKKKKKKDCFSKTFHILSH